MIEGASNRESPRHRPFILTPESCRLESRPLGTEESGPVRHRSFVLTPDSSPEWSPGRVARLQLGIGTIWFLAWSMILCIGADRIAAWLPLNYLLFDLYLCARGAWRSGAPERASPLARRLLAASPVLMLVTAFVLGMFGSRLSGFLA